VRKPERKAGLLLLALWAAALAWLLRAPRGVEAAGPPPPQWGTISLWYQNEFNQGPDSRGMYWAAYPRGSCPQYDVDGDARGWAFVGNSCASQETPCLTDQPGASRTQYFPYMLRNSDGKYFPHPMRIQFVFMGKGCWWQTDDSNHDFYGSGFALYYRDPNNNGGTLVYIGQNNPPGPYVYMAFQRYGYAQIDYPPRFSQPQLVTIDIDGTSTEWLFRYRYYLNEVYLGEVYTNIRPYAWLLGDPTTQQWAGCWNTPYLDYFRVYRINYGGAGIDMNLYTDWGTYWARSTGSATTVNVFTNDTTVSASGYTFAVDSPYAPKRTEVQYSGSANSGGPVQIAGATGSWSWNAPAFSGHTTFAFRPYVTYDINGGSMAVYEVYVDNQGPNTPAAPNITEVGSNYVRLSWSIPTDRGSGGVADGSTEAYGFKYYRAGNVGVLLHRNGPAVGSWTTATSYTDSGLSPNTWYYYQLYARDNNGESRGPWHNYSAMGPASGTYTLPVSPNVTGSRSTNTAYTTDGFSFTNNSGWGAGALDHLHYAWNTSSSGCPSASDPEWRSGTLTLYAGSYGRWYLHLMSHNPNHASGGCVVLGPYVYTAPPSISITRVDVDSRQILYPGSQVFTNDTTPVVYGSAVPQGDSSIVSILASYNGSLGNGGPIQIGSGRSWMHAPPAFSGRTGFAYQAVDSYGLTSATATVEIFVDNQPPVTPSAPSATAVSTSRIDLSWSIPLDQGAGGVSNGWTEAYGNNYYRAGNVGVQVYRGSTVIRNWTTETSMSDTGLVANTAYTYKIRARDNNGEFRGPWHNVSGDSVAVTRYTLPLSPAATCNKPTGVAQGDPNFTFTSSRTFGPGGVDHYHYRWNTNLNDTATASDPVWSSGTLTLQAQPGQNYYLHLTSHNPEHASGGTLTLGPYLYGPPPEIILDRLILDRTINNPADGSVWYTNSTSIRLEGRVDTLLGVKRVEGNSGSGWQTIATSSPWVWELSGREGQVVLQVRAVDVVDQVGAIKTVTIYIDPRAPQTPALSATASGQGRIDLSWNIPLDEGGGSVSAGSTRYAGTLGYRAADVATRLLRGALEIRGWGTGASMSDTGLIPNTLYSYTLQARDNNGEADGPWHNSVAVSLQRWTLAEPPRLLAERAVGEIYMTPEFRFWYDGVWGEGHVDHIHYVFIPDTSYSFSGSEPEWRGGELLVQAPSPGTYYLHVVSHNPEHAWDGTTRATFGPYIYAYPELTFSARYSNLVLNGPDLGLPAQEFSGTLTAMGVPQPGWDVLITLVRPDGGQETYTARTGSDGSFSLGAASSGNDYLGCDEVGDWTARAGLLGVETEAVTWTVDWFEAHGSG